MEEPLELGVIEESWKNQACAEVLCAEYLVTHHECEVVHGEEYLGRLARGSGVLAFFRV